MAILDDKRRPSASDPPQQDGGDAGQSQQQQSQQVLESKRTFSNTTTDSFQVPELETNEEAPPAYGDHHDQLQFTQPGIEAGAAVTGDGRVDININVKNRKLSDLINPVIQRQLAPSAQEPLPPAYIPPALGGRPGQTPPPRLNVVIQIVGSRGDVQPFVALGRILRDTYGHRVRIATHPVFKPFVEENDLEFFSIGGDPAELMAFMVKHPGLMPGFEAVKSGEITKRRKGIAEMLVGCWRSCIEAGDGTGPAPKSHPKGAALDLAGSLPGDPNNMPFVADAIIANPPSFAHIHIAEKMGIPLHMMFTMPWTPTQAFPHPLANIESTTLDEIMTNHLSYTLVEMLTWQGLGDVINRFRERVLDLESLSLIWAPGMLTRLKVPWTYCWSPSLIPKPNDWGNNIDVSGFYFLNLASNYTPDPELAAFLEAGPPPVYIGFGSIVVDDPNAMTRMIFDAIHLTGVRALVSKGWGGLGADDVGIPEGVFMLGNVPHDWLFNHVSCVVHHGGAGTTAAGIKAGKPTLVVPFFGDQPFWGAMIARAKAGPEPIPYKHLTAEKLAEAIKFCLKPDTLARATELGEKIREEQGTDVGGQSFHDHLDVDNLRCVVAPSRAAAWRVRRTKVRLSPLAATVLVNEGFLQYSDLKLYQPREYNTEGQPPDPISAGAVGLFGSINDFGLALADMPREAFKPIKSKRETGRERSSTTASGRNIAALDPTSATASTGASTTSIVPEEGGQDIPSPANITGTLGSTSAITIQSEESITSSPTVTSPTSDPSTMAGHEPPKELRNLDPAPTGDEDPGTPRLDAAIGAGKSVGRLMAVGSKSPMKFTMAVAKGFRNAPRLYNDETVRPIEKVTGLGSGLRLAGKEFGYGVYDGITGLFTQPMSGAQKEGAAGFLKGVGKGIGGVVMKPSAGAWSIPAYAMQGVYVEVNKHFTKSLLNYIMASRVAQGKRDAGEATSQECRDIVARYSEIKADIEALRRAKAKSRTKNLAARDASPGQESTEAGQEPPRTGWSRTRHMTFDERKRLHAEKDAWKRSFIDEPTPSGNNSASTSSADLSSNSKDSEDAEYERAIQASVKETSRGDAEEDAMIEAAVRNTVNAMRAQGGPPKPAPETLDKGALEKDPSIFQDSRYHISDEEYESLIAKAIHQSVEGHHQSHHHHPQEHGVSTLTQAIEQDEPDDSDLQRALEESRNMPPSRPGDDDEELRLAIEASKEEEAREKSQKTEEDIVLEYVKKQSLAEEEFRKTAQKGKAADDGEDDEELRLAMEQSLQMGHGSNAGPSGSSGS